MQTIRPSNKNQANQSRKIKKRKRKKSFQSYQWSKLTRIKWITKISILKLKTRKNRRKRVKAIYHREVSNKGNKKILITLGIETEIKIRSKMRKLILKKQRPATNNYKTTKKIKKIPNQIFRKKSPKLNLKNFRKMMFRSW
jgi:hypothetical protein